MSLLLLAIGVSSGAVSSLLLLRSLLQRLGRPPHCTAPYAVAAAWLAALGTQAPAWGSWPPDPLVAASAGVLLGAVASASSKPSGFVLPLLAASPPLLATASLSMALGRIEPSAWGAAVAVAFAAALGQAALHRMGPQLPPWGRPWPAAVWLLSVGLAALTHGSLRLGALSLGAATGALLLALSTTLGWATASTLPTVASAIAGAGLWASWRLAALPSGLALPLLLVPAASAAGLVLARTWTPRRRWVMSLLPALLALLLAIGLATAPSVSSPSGSYGYEYEQTSSP